MFLSQDRRFPEGFLVPQLSLGLFLFFSLHLNIFQYILPSSCEKPLHKVYSYGLNFILSCDLALKSSPRTLWLHVYKHEFVMWYSFSSTIVVSFIYTLVLPFMLILNTFLRSSVWRISSSFFWCLCCEGNIFFSDPLGPFRFIHFTLKSILSSEYSFSYNLRIRSQSVLSVQEIEVRLSMYAETKDLAQKYKILNNKLMLCFFPGFQHPGGQWSAQIIEKLL